MDVRLTAATIDDLRLDHAVPAEPSGAPPVLYVHGLWGGAWVFEHYLAFTATTGREAWAINLRGHHRSRPVADLGRVALEDYVRDVADVLDVIGPAVVVGHSMGGLIAQAVASRPDVVAAVFMASVPPPGIPLLSWPLVCRAPRYALDVLRPRAFSVRPADARALALNAVPASRQAAIAARFVEDSGLAARQIAFGEFPAPRPPRCPVLVIGAGEDRLTPARLQRRIAAHYAADYVETPPHGHMLPVEVGWQAPIARVLTWLERVTAQAGRINLKLARTCS